MGSLASIAIALSGVCLLGLSTGANIPSLDATMCPYGWLGPSLSVCYKLVDDTPMTWNDAANEGCKAVNSKASLATITFENKAFLSKQPEIFMTEYFWIGYRSSDLSWGGAEPQYSNWEHIRYQEPNGIEAHGDNCAVVLGKSAPDEFNYPGRWMDWACGDQSTALCQLRPTDGECPSEWTKQDGVCYRLNTKRTSWYSASAGCAELNGDAELAAAPFTYEQMVDSGIYETDFFWVALRSTDVDAEGKLHWADGAGAEVTNVNWLTLKYDEPSGTPPGKNDCVMVNGLWSSDLFTTGEWGDMDCGYKSGFLCELHLS